MVKMKFCNVHESLEFHDTLYQINDAGIAFVLTENIVPLAWDFCGAFFFSFLSVVLSSDKTSAKLS